MARLIWSPEAVSDLENICLHIAEDSQEYARIFAQELVALVESLESHPRMGRIVPEYREDALRERIYHNYRLIYELTPTRIEIVAVVHGARDLSSLPRR